MYDGNPGEFDFGSSQREVRVSEGSSYRESTVFVIIQDTLYVAGRLTANENHTLWFLIFVESTGGSVAVYVVDS